MISSLLMIISNCVCRYLGLCRDLSDFISSLIPLWLKNILWMTWILLNLLRHVLWVTTRSVLVNDSCILKKNVYSAVSVWSLLQMPWVKLADGIVQVFYILTDFLSTGSIHNGKKAVEISECNCGLVCFSFRFYHYLLPVFWSSAIRYTTI